jgi:hypothetical protein
VSRTAKIDFGYRRARNVADVTDLVAVVLPGNRNQQHAAARMLLLLRAAHQPIASFLALEREHGISRRTMERTRAKLACLGLIERVTWMHRRHGGQEGWVLSGRMSTALRQLAERIDSWRADTSPPHQEKEVSLALLLRP